MWRKDGCYKTEMSHKIKESTAGNQNITLQIFLLFQEKWAPSPE
jgi:hypothetical protein